MSTDITIQKPKEVSLAINLLIVSLVLGAIMFPLTLITMFKSSPFVVLLFGISQIIMQTTSLIMIYSKTANEWFNLKSNR